MRSVWRMGAIMPCPLHASRRKRSVLDPRTGMHAGLWPSPCACIVSAADPPALPWQTITLAHNKRCQFRLRAQRSAGRFRRALHKRLHLWSAEAIAELTEVRSNLPPPVPGGILQKSFNQRDIEQRCGWLDGAFIEEFIEHCTSLARPARSSNRLPQLAFRRPTPWASAPLHSRFRPY